MNIDEVIKRNRADQQSVASDLKAATRVHHYLRMEESLLSRASEVIERREAARAARLGKKLPSFRCKTMGLRPEDIDLTGAETLGEKVRRVAEQAPSNEVNLTETTDLLLALGASDYDQGRLRAMVYQRFDRLPDFEKIARGWWRLITEVEQDESRAEEAFQPSEMELLVDLAESLNLGRLDLTSTANSMGLRAEDLDMEGAVTRWQQVLRIAAASPTTAVSVKETVDLLISLGLLREAQRESTRKWVRTKLQESPDFRYDRPDWFTYIGGEPAKPVEAEPEVQPQPVLPSSTPQLMRWLPGDVDYSNATNLAQKLVHIARHTSDQLVEPTQAADRLRKEGMSRQRAESLTRLVRRTLRRHTSFQETANGWFRLGRRRSPGVSSAQVAPEGYPNRAIYTSGRISVDFRPEETTDAGIGSTQNHPV